MDISKLDAHSTIPGTTFFDGRQAMKGYALNKMCYSFNAADAREEFKAGSEAYFDKFELSEPQKEAVRSKDVLQMIEVGGNIYYLAKLAGIFGLNMQDIGAQQTGVTPDQFREKLLRQGD